MHSGGFVHRDVHPGNITIVDDVAKISDMEFVKERNVTILREAPMRIITRPPSRALTEVRTVRPVRRNSVLLRLTNSVIFLPSQLCSHLLWIGVWSYWRREMKFPQTDRGMRVKLRISGRLPQRRVKEKQPRSRGL